MDKQKVIFRDLGLIEYKEAWNLQEELLAKNVAVKAAGLNDESFNTTDYFLLCEHPPVYTLGKSGKMEHVLLSEEGLREKGISFYQTNRGGDITFHGLQQIVGYPILDLEKFGTDIGKYLRNIEEVIIKAIGQYGLKGERSSGETGVWLDTGKPGRERKICAIGVRCSRWITMHGFALNVNTDLRYFDFIIPCGIQNKQVTSMERETGHSLDVGGVKDKIRYYFEEIFNVQLTTEELQAPTL